MWKVTTTTSIHIVSSKWRVCYSWQQVRSSQGELDVDMNVESYVSLEPVENIYWPENEAPIGVNRVFVHHYQNHQCGYNSAKKQQA